MYISFLATLNILPCWEIYIGRYLNFYFDQISLKYYRTNFEEMERIEIFISGFFRNFFFK